MNRLFSNFGNLNEFLSDALIMIVPALICITIHELAHGFTAYKLGDRTAKDLGRLTLNPIKHLDPAGFIMIVIVGFGWAKPVPVDMRNFKHPKRDMAITALAGPLSNIILAIFVLLILGLVTTALGIFTDPATGIVYWTQETGFLIFRIISRMVVLNITLAVFNMLPLPPLDGSKVLFSLLPEKAYYNLMRYERYGMIALLVIVGLQLIFSINIFGRIIGYPAEVIYNGLRNVFFGFTYNLVN